jgi:hypothetical protein
MQGIPRGLSNLDPKASKSHAEPNLATFPEFAFLYPFPLPPRIAF